MISRSYSAMTAGSTLYCVFGRESRMRRSSALWHVSSGYVGTAFGAGPRSPTMSSPSPIQSVLRSQIAWKFMARSTGMLCRPICSW